MKQLSILLVILFTYCTPQDIEQSIAVKDYAEPVTSETVSDELPNWIYGTFKSTIVPTHNETIINQYYMSFDFISFGKGIVEFNNNDITFQSFDESVNIYRNDNVINIKKVNNDIEINYLVREGSVYRINMFGIFKRV